MSESTMRHNIALGGKKSVLVLLKAKLHGFLHKIEVDKAVFFGILAKIWGTIFGPLTALLIVIKFTPEYQGYYYTFNGLLALQIFVELGLGVVVVQFASHEWSKLKLDPVLGITGDKEALSRLASLVSIVSKWYLVGGTIIALCLGAGGYIFFTHSHNSNISWQLPWFFLCFFTAVLFSLSPILNLLEGCNQVSALYNYRFFQGVISSLILCVFIFSGAKLWSAPISVAGVIVYTFLFLKCKYSKFIKRLLSVKAPDCCINWKKEVFPMQWRIAVSTISSYFMFFLFTPVIFNYYGPVVAGQFGMTWSLVIMVSTISSPWIHPKIPMFGMLIAKKEYNELDILFRRIMKIFVVNTMLTTIAVWLLVYILNKLSHPLSARLLPLLPMTLFLLAQVIMALAMPFVAYLRAHKVEPMLPLSVCCAILTSLAVFILGKYYSIVAIGLGYLVINIMAVTYVVLLWHHCRKKWHVEAELT